MKRLLRPGRKRNLFLACLRAATFCLLFALTALVVAETPLRYAGNSLRETATTTHTASIAAQPAVTVVPPFVGDHSETWEEFPVQKFGSSVVSIFGGIATVSGTRLETQRSGVFRNCGNYETASDGIILMGGDALHDLVTISFSQPVSAFGAYWDANACLGAGPDITFIFYDPNGNQVGTDIFPAAGDGTLTWRGYAFDTPVKTITYKGEYPVTDGMQVTVQNAVNLKITSITHPATNTIHLNCVGAPNVINRIEWSPDLSPGSFNTLASVMAGANGAFQYDDTGAGTKKFYRVAYP